MIIDMHVHTLASLDSPAGAEDYCRAICRFREYHPFDGLVLTEHRVFDHHLCYEKISEKYGVLIFKGIELDTDLGHLLLYGITDEFLRRTDISNRRLSGADIVRRIEDCGGIAIPAHPFRESGYGQALEEKRENVSGITAIETLNGVNTAEENQKASALAVQNGLHGIGGSDAHFANHHWFLTCATRFDTPVFNDQDLVSELKNGAFSPIRLDNSVMGTF
jgi:predicted metal-dependent phosphoesterase TrpH